MNKDVLKGEYRGIKYKYSLHNSEDEFNGLLIVNLPNGVESTHIIKGWGIIRVFQYIESMRNLL